MEWHSFHSVCALSGVCTWGCLVVEFVEGLLGAAKVTLTDYTPDLIETLNANVEIMTEANPSCRYPTITLSSNICQNHSALRESRLLGRLEMHVPEKMNCVSNLSKVIRSVDRSDACHNIGSLHFVFVQGSFSCALAELG